MDFSLRGAARKYGGRTGDFSVRACMFGGSLGSGGRSLRSRLVSMCREDHSFSMSECIYGWTAAFEQIWSHVIVRIDLDPDASISAATVAACRQRWESGIVNTWSRRWGVGRPGELTTRLTFEVVWTASGAHHEVQVAPGFGGTDMTHWHSDDSAGVAAHEFGHMLGNEDEYSSSICPSRSPVNTGTVMDNNSDTVPARLVRHFATNVGSNIVAT